MRKRKYRGEKTTLEWPKLVSETIFPTDWGYIWSEKSGFRFSFGAPKVPETNFCTFVKLVADIDDNGLSIYCTIRDRGGVLQNSLKYYNFEREMEDYNPSSA